MALQQTKIGKLHLIKRDGVKYLTACGVVLSWQHMALPAVEPWTGQDKCRKCAAALERGDMGFRIVTGGG